MDQQPQPVSPQQNQPSLPAQQKASGLAIASMVVSIVGLVLSAVFIGGLIGLVGLILAIVSLAKKKAGRGFAIAGVIIGAVAIISGVLFGLITIVAYDGIQQRARESQQKSLESQQRSQEKANEALGY